MAVQRRTLRRTFSEGERRGGLTYVREAGFSAGKKQVRLVLLHCDCGVEIETRVDSWQSSKSCGCRNGTHRQAGTPLYRSWAHMKQRGKRVGLDRRWLTFQGFLDHPPRVGPSPIDGLTREYQPGLCLCRTGDVGPYSPENCRWDTRSNNSREQHSVASRLPFGRVLEMRARYAAGGVSQYRLADEYGINQTQVSNIITGKDRRTE